MKYECVKQLDETDCAAACISTICLKYGLKKSITRIRELAGTDKNGTNGVGLIQACKKLGLDAEGYMIDSKELTKEIKYPCIAHTQDERVNHYMVIHSYEKEMVTVADPAKGICYYSKEDFDKIWTGVIFLVTPNEKLAEQQDDTKTINLWKLVFSEKKKLAGILIASIIYSVLGIASTLFFKLVFDYFVPNSLFALLTKVALGFIAISVMTGVIQFLRVRLILLLGKSMDMELTYKSYAHIIHLPMNFFSSRQTGEIISRLNDSSKIRDVLSGATISALVDVVMAVASFIVLVYYSSRLSIVVFICFFAYLITNLLFIKKIRENNKKNMEKAAQTNAMFIETIKGVETIKACGAEDLVCDNSRNIFTDLLDTVIYSQNTECVLSIISGIINKTGYILVLLFGANMVMNNNISIGVLLTFYSLIGYFFSPVQSIMHLQTNMQGALVAFDRLNQMMECEVEKINYVGNTTQLSGKIEVDDVVFRYGSRKTTLNGISFSIEPNEKVAIVGESGSGKTTMAKLLMGFYDFEAGDICFDNKSIKELDKGWLRNQIGFVPQEPYFFKGTIKDNLLFGNDGVYTDEEIFEVLKLVKLDGYLMENPEGIYTKLQENATNLSGGQRQRLSIARALIRKPKILILDEATSNLDVITEKSLTDAIDDLKNITIIVIAHRLSTVKRCDKIIVLKDGKTYESGPHNELLEKNGYYYSLWNKIAG